MLKNRTAKYAFRAFAGALSFAWIASAPADEIYPASPTGPVPENCESPLYTKKELTKGDENFPALDYQIENSILTIGCLLNEGYEDGNLEKIEEAIKKIQQLTNQHLKESNSGKSLLTVNGIWDENTETSFLRMLDERALFWILENSYAYEGDLNLEAAQNGFITLIDNVVAQKAPEESEPEPEKCTGESSLPDYFGICGHSIAEFTSPLKPRSVAITFSPLKLG